MLRWRWSVRRMMIGVALVAVLFWFGLLVVSTLVDILNDEYFLSESTIAETWDAGPNPRVVVDLFAGTINVIQGDDGNVSASLRTRAMTWYSRERADEAHDSIVVATEQDGETIRIRSSNPEDPPAFRLETWVELRVPPGAILDLQTGDGNIMVGKQLGGPSRAHWVSAPVAIGSVKARDRGSIYSGIEAEIRTDPDAEGPTVVDLESDRGRIFVAGDDLIVSAKADVNIRFDGRLAPGSHAFEVGPRARSYAKWQALKGIQLTLPADSAFEVEAEPGGGSLRVEFPGMPTFVESSGDFSGAVGDDPAIKLDLRSRGAPITILPDPAGPTGGELP